MSITMLYSNIFLIISPYNDTLIILYDKTHPNTMESDNSSSYSDVEMELASMESSNNSDNSQWELNQQKPKKRVPKVKMPPIPNNLSEFWKKFENIDFRKYFQVPETQQVPKSVCAKNIQIFETIIECYDCAVDSSCIICLQCFKNGNHQGHRYVAKKAGGGCCDCGDSEAWNPKGFCSNHSGQLVEFEIPKHTQQQFFKITDGLFYLYFYSLKVNHKNRQKYMQKIIHFFSQLNDTNLYYNKLTTLSLIRTLPPPYKISKQIDDQTVLQNLLTFKLNGKYFNQWWEMLYKLFAYYPFKTYTLECYIKKFSSLADVSGNGGGCVSSIGCQLMTSWKLVDQYARHNSVGLGQGSEYPTKSSLIWSYFILIFHNYKYILNLSETAPLTYWKMHIKSGVGHIFDYYHLILAKAKNMQSNGQTATAILNKYKHFTQVEWTMLQTFVRVFGLIIDQPALLKKLIRFFWKKCKTIPEHRNLLHYCRPYERCLTLALFAYFDQNLNSINPGSVNQLLQQILVIDAQSMKAVCNRILRDLYKTYFVYSKCTAEPGYGQSLYSFIYFYKIKSRLVSNIDILCIRMMHLLINEPISLNFQELIEYDESRSYDEKQRAIKEIYLCSVLKQVSYVLFTDVPEIYVSFALKPDLKFYVKQAKAHLRRIFEQFDGTVSESRFEELKKIFFPEKCNYSLEWLQEHTQRIRDSSNIQLISDKEQRETEKGVHLPLFWLNEQVINSDIQASKIIPLVNLYTVKLTEFILNQSNLQSLHNTLTVVYLDETKCAKQCIESLMEWYFLHKQFELQNQNIFRNHIFAPFKSCLSKQQSEYLGFEMDIEQNTDNKEKLRALKEKKLKQFKQKQNKFGTKLSQIDCEAEEEGDQKVCYICKNGNPEDFVFLVDVSIRNHEKLLGIGPGLQCVSFTSCRHLFDRQCVLKQFKANKIVNSISCPLCKVSANIMLPYGALNTKKRKLFMQRLIQVTFQLSEQIDFYEELIKSFYHLCLLGSIDLDYTLTYRIEIYSILLSIIAEQIPAKSLKAIKSKFSSNKMSRKFDKEMENPKGGLTQMPRDLLLMLSGNMNDDLFEIQSETPIKVDRTENEKIKKGKSHSKERAVENSSLFQRTMPKLFDVLSDLLTHIQSQKKMHEETEEHLLPDLHSIARGKVRQMLEQVSIGEKLTHSLLIDLPKKYTEVGRITKCSECKQIGSDIIMCLLCGWTGCQRRQCPEGLARAHTQKSHGSITVLLYVHSGSAYYFSGKVPSVAGPLYLNRWGKALRGSKEWDEYEINQELLKEIQRNMLLGIIPKQSAH